MATLYDIDSRILDCIDRETGEIIDPDRLSELHLERDAKLENVALWIKNLEADTAAYKAEKESFAAKEKAASQLAECLKIWLASALDGERFNTTKVQVSFRRSGSVEIDSTQQLPGRYMKMKTEFIPDKNVIRDAIKAGNDVPGCRLVTKQNIRIR